jgi:hypothetical protein
MAHRQFMVQVAVVVGAVAQVVLLERMLATAVQTVLVQMPQQTSVAVVAVLELHCQAVATVVRVV